MRPRTAEQIEEWPSREFSGGYRGLRDLTESGFTGAVTANGACLFMLNGHAVGVADGTVESFDGASGTAYGAPDDALPLLFAMLERGGEKRGQYYTERTSLEEVDRTLSQGGFTGYVELSENVHSGDYYAVYYGGEAMYAAFVGQSDRLLTGAEAERRANEEVGLYDVVAVDVSVVELPEPTDENAHDAGGEALTPTPTPAANGTSDEGDGVVPSGPTEEAANDPPVDGSTAAVDEPGAGDDADDEAPSDAASSTADELDLESALAGEGATQEPPERAAPMDDSTTPGRPEAAPDPESGATDGEDDDAPAGGVESSDEAVAASLDGVELDEDPTPPTVPGGLTPAVDDADDADPSPPVAGDDVSRPTGPDSEATPEFPDAEESSESDDADSGSELDDLFEESDAFDGTDELDGDEGGSDGAELAGVTAGDGGDDERVAELEARLADLSAENERLAEERSELVAERERLEARVAELESDGAGGTPPADVERVSPEEALRATDLFVRYQSKGAETLKEAHAGADNRQAVKGNLDLEHHTRFDAERTAVGDREFREFLPQTLEYELVTWLVGDLLYEIRDTGHVEGLRPLYDALPRIDRADLRGEVEVGRRDEEDVVAFDVVCRDRLGNPLLCLDVYDSRDPATDVEMEALLEKSARVGEVHDDFACAFLVASSFFEPSALELATEKTASGGLFGGGKRESFVKLSRKRGYHLCLVEARERRFHVTMPEL